MEAPLIKKVDEKNLNNDEKQVDILFESSVNGEKKQKTITLTGKGNVKALLPV